MYKCFYTNKNNVLEVKINLKNTTKMKVMGHNCSSRDTFKWIDLNDGVIFYFHMK